MCLFERGGVWQLSSIAVVHRDNIIRMIDYLTRRI